MEEKAKEEKRRIGGTRGGRGRGDSGDAAGWRCLWRHGEKEEEVAIGGGGWRECMRKRERDSMMGGSGKKEKRYSWPVNTTSKNLEKNTCTGGRLATRY